MFKLASLHDSIPGEKMPRIPGRDVHSLHLKTAMAVDKYMGSQGTKLEEMC